MGLTIKNYFFASTITNIILPLKIIFDRSNADVMFSLERNKDSRNIKLIRFSYIETHRRPPNVLDEHQVIINAAHNHNALFMKDTRINIGRQKFSVEKL